MNLDDTRIRLKADMIKTFREHNGSRTFVSGPLLDALVDDAMFYLEQRQVDDGEQV